MLFYIAGCKNYYKVGSVSKENLATIDNIGDMYRTVFIHWHNDSYNLNEVSVDSASISGNIEFSENVFDYQHQYNNRYKNAEKNIIDDVHIYLRYSFPMPNPGMIKIDSKYINKIEVIERNSGKTIMSYVLGGIGILAGVYVLVGIIVLLTKSSCPYIYVYDGEGFAFQGETYGGAIAENLIRDDYMPLPSLKIKNGRYNLQIRNELKERQYTDLARLIIINHKNDEKVLLDNNGAPQIIKKVEQPIHANSYSGENLIPILQTTDKNVFMFNEEDYSRNGIIMKFNKPEDAKSAKLILNAKNSLWFDYLYGEFIEKFGGRYDKYMEEQKEISSEERLQRVVDSDFPLFVYVRNGDKWKPVDYFYTVGPLASRDLIMPIDLSGVTDEMLELKIETGFMFWELDYAGIDYSNNGDLNITEQKPAIAVGNKVIDWCDALSETDNRLMIQESVGDITELVFDALEVDPGQLQSLFLHTRGYYELIRDFKGLPKTSQLLKFKEPGYFSDYSRERYMNVLGKHVLLANNSNN